MAEFPIETQPSQPERPIQILVDFLIEQDPATLLLEEEKKEIRERQAKNRKSILSGDFFQTEPYQIEEVFPIKKYPINVARRGTLLTRAVAQHPHLPENKSLPDIRYLTNGDIYAASFWGIRPELEPSQSKNIDALKEAALIVDDIQAQAALRAIYNRQHYQLDQSWPIAERFFVERNISLPDAKVLLGDNKNYFSHPPSQEELKQYLLKPDNLAELFVLTMCARLGSHLKPGLLAYQPRTKLDRLGHVDTLLHVLDEHENDWLVGIDVTLRRSKEAAGEKEEKIRKQRQTHTADPLTGNKLSLIKRVLFFHISVNVIDVYKKWLRQGRATTITPDFSMHPIDRKTLVQDILKLVCTHNGERIYSEETIEEAYQSVYGYYDQSTQDEPK